MTIITDERCTAYHSPGHPERPFRISGPVKKLKAQTDLKLEWLKPEPATKEKVLRAHTTNHFHRLTESHDFDGDTAYHEGIRDHALRSAGGALKAVELARAAMGAELGTTPTLESLKSFVEPLNGRKVPSHAILVTYRDGLRATILRIGSSDFRWNFACSIAGDGSPASRATASSTVGAPGRRGR